MADINFEDIQPFVEGQGDTGQTARAKIKRNFDKVAENLGDMIDDITELNAATTNNTNDLNDIKEALVMSSSTSTVRHADLERGAINGNLNSNIAYDTSLASSIYLRSSGKFLITDSSVNIVVRSQTAQYTPSVLQLNACNADNEAVAIRTTSDSKWTQASSLTNASVGSYIRIIIQILDSNNEPVSEITDEILGSIYISNEDCSGVTFDDSNSTLAEEVENEYYNISELANAIDALESQQSQLSSDLDDIKETLSDQTSITIATTGYIHKSGTSYNENSTDSNWVKSGYIAVGEATKLHVNLKSNTNGNIINVSFYTGEALGNHLADGELIITEENPSGAWIYYEGDVPIPDSAVYVRICSGKASGDFTPSAALIGDKVSAMDGELSELQSNLAGINSDLYRTETLSTIEVANGLIAQDGSLSFTTDSHWELTDFIPISGVKSITYNLKSYTGKMVLAFYSTNANSAIIQGEGIVSEGNMTPLYHGTINADDIPNGAKFIRCSYASSSFGNYVPSLEIICLSIGDSNSDKVTDTVVFPKNIYLVCNDANNNPYNRNISPVIYLDHCFRNLAEEKKINFENGDVKLPFDFPTASTSGWSPTLNGGNNVNTEVKSVKVIGDDIDETTISVNVISTKASASANVTPRVLVIGDSITEGEGATYHSKGWNGDMKVKPFHAICKEFFMKDNIEQGGGNDIILIGTRRHTGLSFDFGGSQHNYDDHHEGIRGYTINNLFTSQNSKFRDDNGNFSIASYVSKYRTMDDNGNRLALTDANIGTLITASNINTYDVCTPTHIIYLLGTNGGGTLEQYTQLVSQAKTDFPDCHVALAIVDSAGTIFPSKYKDATPSKCRWNITNVNNNRHLSCFDIQKIFNENFDNDTQKANGVYVLPFFFVSSPMFFSSRESNLPECDIVGEEAKHEAEYGWYPATHLDIRAHYNMAYQMYAWIKFTLTSNNNE